MDWRKVIILTRAFIWIRQSVVLSLPLTSLGAAGASIAGAKTLADAGLLTSHDMTVYFAIGYSLVGFLSTHASISDSLGMREITTKAMLSHLIGGVIAVLSQTTSTHLSLPY